MNRTPKFQRNMLFLEVKASEVNAFTLIEILVVLSIIVVLIALIYGATISALRSAKEAQNISNLKSLGAASLLYAADHGGRLPPDGTYPGEWFTIGMGITPMYGMVRHLYSPNVTFGLATTPYVENVDIFYNPLSQKYKDRPKGKLFMTGVNSAEIGYIAYCLPRNPANPASTVNFNDTVRNDTLRESANAPLYSDFCASFKGYADSPTNRCAVVYLGGHVRTFSHGEVPPYSWNQVIEFFAGLDYH